MNNQIYCPQCGSNRIFVTLEKTTKGLFIGWLCVLIGMIILLGIIGLLVGFIVGIVFLVIKAATPGKKPVGICQNCSHVFDPRTGRKVNL